MMTLSGRVVKVEDGHGNIIPTSSFQLESGKDMMGEIIDIVDINEMDSIDEIVRRQSGSRATPVLVKSGEDLNSQSLANISQRILQKQRSLQSRHAQEHQQLLQKQNKDWMWFHSHSLGERSLVELETIHQRECTEMHSRQQTEQKEMFDFAIFDCMPTFIKSCHGREQQPEPPDSSNVPESVSTDLQKAAESKAVMRNRSMTRDERQNELIKIKERYAPPMVAAVSPLPINNVEKNGAMATGSGPSRWEIMVGGATRETDDDADDVLVKAGEGNSANMDKNRDKIEAYEGASRRWGSVATKIGTSNLVLKVYGDSTWKLDTAEIKGNDGDKHAEIVPQAKEKAKESRVGEPTSKAVTDNDHNDPLDTDTNRDPVKQLVPRLNRNDPSLTVLKLDGRKQIKGQDWQSLFESLERNTLLTHLSIARCELNDSLCVALMLALVENETLIELRLSSNKGLTDETGKGLLKVLKVNTSLKAVHASRTKFSKQVMEELDTQLDKRNSKTRRASIQDERQNKIKELLSFSASDKVKKEYKASEVEEEKALDGISSKSKKNKDSSKKSLNSKSSGKLSASSIKQSRSTEFNVSFKSKMHKSVCRASMTAKTMAQLGGDNIMNVGVDMLKLREQRKFRGECESCGQKCFTKTLFKTTPLNVPNLVNEGQCLRCEL